MIQIVCISYQHRYRHRRCRWSWQSATDQRHQHQYFGLHHHRNQSCCYLCGRSCHRHQCWSYIDIDGTIINNIAIIFSSSLLNTHRHCRQWDLHGRCRHLIRCSYHMRRCICHHWRVQATSIVVIAICHHYFIDAAINRITSIIALILLMLIIDETILHFDVKERSPFCSRPHSWSWWNPFCNRRRRQCISPL